MNLVIVTGRICNDIDIKYYNGGSCNCKFNLAVDKDYKVADGAPKADFIPITVWGKPAENLEKYSGKGRKITVTGRIDTGSYVKDDGTKVYTWGVTANRWEFADSKPDGASRHSEAGDLPAGDLPKVDANGFMNIPDGIDEELPFN